MELGLIIIAVDELAPAVGFWRALTGWSAVEDVPGVYAELRTPAGQRFGLYAVEHYVNNLGPMLPELVPAVLQRTELYVQVDDAWAVLERAIGLGATRLSEVTAKPWGDDVGYALAPGGFVLAVAQPHDGR